MRTTIITHAGAFLAGAAIAAVIGYFTVVAPVRADYAELDERRAEAIAELERDVSQRERVIEERSRELDSAIERARERGERIAELDRELVAEIQRSERILGALGKAQKRAERGASELASGLRGDRELAESIKARAQRIARIAVELDRGIREAIERGAE